MRTPRIHTVQPLEVGSSIVLDDEQGRHLIRVLRLRQGAAVTLFNGDGAEYLGEITGQDRSRVEVTLGSHQGSEPPPALAIHLGIAVSKGERMDFAIQKAVELGVSVITPLLSQRSVVRVSQQRWSNKINHWRKIIIAACEQSGRCRVPELEAPVELADWLGGTGEGLSLLLDHRSGRTLSGLTPPESRVTLLVGPEGGLTREERDAAQARGFLGVALGPRVLRTETAPLAAMAAMQAMWGDFR